MTDCTPNRNIQNDATPRDFRAEFTFFNDTVSESPAWKIVNGLEVINPEWVQELLFALEAKERK